MHAKPKGRGPEFGSVSSYQFCLPPPITTYLPLNTSVCSTQTYLPQKTIIQPKKTITPSKTILSLSQQEKKKKASRTFQLVISFLKRLYPFRYKHLALHHLTAPARNVGAINKLYYSTLAFQ